MGNAKVVVNGQEVVVNLVDKTFSSGKTGYFGQTKAQIGQKQYQFQVMGVEVNGKTK